jgi:bifunctional NMN adenylyltransferase/nudix hydrolase
MNYDLLAYIGRFQPFHLGHQMVIKEALKQSQRLLILVGSTNQPRTPKNPWTYEERVSMIHASLSIDEQARVIFLPLRDRPYNEEQWIESVQRAVQQSRAGAQRISLVGYTKDETSYYLKKFPQWPSHVEAPVKETINATDLRNAYFKRKFMAGAPLYLPPNVTAYLKEFENTEHYQYIVNEQKFLDEHAAMWAFAKYPPTFNTGDAVVIQSGHILLIERKFAPGKSLWALPGGYVDQSKGDKTYLDAAIRELCEETRIDVPESVLRNRVKESKIFSDPNRSLRGWIFTEASLIHLDQHGSNLPKTKASDDANKRKWFSFAQFRKMEQIMFEDHYHIASYFIDRV